MPALTRFVPARTAFISHTPAVDGQDCLRNAIHGLSARWSTLVIRLSGRNMLQPGVIEPPFKLCFFQRILLTLRFGPAVQKAVFLCMAGILLTRQTFAYASQVDDFCHDDRCS